MEYSLTIRRIVESDLGHNCHFLPEYYDLDMHLNALMEDIESINGVLDANQN